ncbi:hypothetical protein IE90_10520 [Sanguibacteroides justesenii]|uniref:Uncharacterized protein n=1 Tax=Sanguibacteroides justesenii TaxID=1547597 RepID=A0AB34R4Z7_9PORP|nr:hypothetical protein IE90_10520 [Sanguibacteroides justesenii]
METDPLFLFRLFFFFTVWYLIRAVNLFQWFSACLGMNEKFVLIAYIVRMLVYAGKIEHVFFFENFLTLLTRL